MKIDYRSYGLPGELLEFCHNRGRIKHIQLKDVDLAQLGRDCKALKLMGEEFITSNHAAELIESNLKT